MAWRAPLTKTERRASLFVSEAADYRWQSGSSERRAKARSSAASTMMFIMSFVVAVLNPSVARKIIL